MARLGRAVMPVARAETTTGAGPLSLEQLVRRGRAIFKTETFGGNGRTCETCHREKNNFTIDPQFIATLPPDDPLFVGENNPDLGPQFENPRLLRELGLVLLNTDGFEDLSSKFVMRGVPSLLAISTSIRATNATGQGAPDGTTIPPNDRLGYAGDGAPGTGTLREFAIGAITQHMTRSLQRVPGVDFRLPTAEELDALEAFQRSLGRQSDPNIRTMQLKSVVAAKGQEIFLNPGTGKCFFCHSNGGATLDGGFGKGINANFNVGVQALHDTPAALTGELVPLDGGFGKGLSADGSFGNGTFNTLTVIEAADTGPFFHDNSIPTIEGAVEFYNSAAFNTAPIPPGLKIKLESTQVTAVASYLRVLNALENVRSSTDLATRARAATDGSDSRDLLGLSLVDVDDAIRVLSGGLLHQNAQAKLQRARAYLLTAQIGLQIPIIRNFVIDKGLTWLTAARADMLVETPPGP
jgi:cytochrome c peroxidase